MQNETQSTLAQVDQSNSVCTTAKKLENVLNYQRSIVVQTSILRHRIGEQFFEQIDQGDIHELTLEQLESFLAAYPKEQEIEALQAAIQKHGIFILSEALEKLECGKTEQFMLQVLTHRSNLH